MITRRAFLALLSSLPFVGKMIPREPEQFSVAFDWDTVPLLDIHPIMRDGKTVGFVRDPWEPMTFEGQPVYIGETYVVGDDGRLHRPRLTFAEWDRKYQA